MCAAHFTDADNRSAHSLACGDVEFTGIVIDECSKMASLCSARRFRFIGYLTSGTHRAIVIGNGRRNAASATQAQALVANITP
ncbi:hypothetical protein [Paraburkholderia sp.]|uniref:hypothetical protein n=1 Tax=Paraburkholderia sp. TaxID=1926495 RepID=UPI0025E578FE|nr:hypothetical protein [Paraburkholderia sp.]